MMKVTVTVTQSNDDADDNDDDEEEDEGSMNGRIREAEDAEIGARRGRPEIFFLAMIGTREHCLSEPCAWLQLCESVPVEVQG